MNINNNLRHLLENETKIHLAEIRFLYQKLDRQLGLNGARVPITFGFDTDRLGAYSPKASPDGEGFHFSLLFIGYCVAKPLSKDDRMDLYKHEYAHYMQYNMDIPDKYNWQPGIHGSVKLADDDYLEHAYLLAGHQEYTISYHDKEYALNKVRLAKRDTKGIKPRI